MKKVLWCILFTALLFVCTVVSVETVYGTENFSGYEADLVNDNSGVFLTLKNRNILYVKKVAPEGSEYKFEFENRIAASCIYDNKIYVLYDSAQQEGISYVEKFQNGESKSKIMLMNFKHPTITQMSVDKNGNIYIINSKSRVETFNRNGKYLNTSSDVFYSITPLGGKTYASSRKGIFTLSTDGSEKLGSYSDISPIYRISDNFLGNRNGNVYSIKNGVQKILNTGNEITNSCGETKDYLVSFRKNTLNAYDKKNGKLINSVAFEYTPHALSAYNNKVVALDVENGNYSIKSKNEKIFDKQETHQIPENSGADSSLSLKFGKFKPKGKYIYTPQGTTYYQFKQSITYNGYDINFGKRKSGNIGTGGNVTFSIGKKEKKYIFIVPGDVTGEGNVNTRDIDALFAHLLKSSSLEGAYKKAADLNGDSKISNADLVLTVKNYQKLRS